ncbi:MAG: hypothetical protein Q8936_00705 [Bacillota bacterium]|nr:hypothetical protein [Bacillota bacterium]
MYGYRDPFIGSDCDDSSFYCPYRMYEFQCPLCTGKRQKVEEYPIQQQQPPKNPPPNYTPKLSDVPVPNLILVEFGAISPCIFKNTYIWLKNGESFWSYLTFISRNSVAGWRYINNRWVYFTTNLNQIKNYICS